MDATPASRAPISQTHPPPWWSSIEAATILGGMRHSVLLCRFVGALAALALLLALSAQAGMAMPVPCNSKTAAMVMPDGAAAMPSCDGCGGDDGVGMAMGASIALARKSVVAGRSVVVR